jgi:hypothetical protein
MLFVTRLLQKFDVMCLIYDYCDINIPTFTTIVWPSINLGIVTIFIKDSMHIRNRKKILNKFISVHKISQYCPCPLLTGVLDIWLQSNNISNKSNAMQD